MISTKMKLYRHGEFGHELWAYQKITVDQAYLDSHLADPLLVELINPFVMSKNMLDVYFKGHHLTEGSDYTEVDSTHIRLDLGVYPEGGAVPLQLGDEIVIRTWKEPPYSSESNGPNDKEVLYLLGDGDYDVTLVYDSSGEFVEKETTIGDMELTRDFTYNSFGKPLREVVSYKNKIITKDFTYNGEDKLLSVKVRTVVI